MRWRSHIKYTYSNLLIPKFAGSSTAGSIQRAFENLEGLEIQDAGLSSAWPLDSDQEFAKFIAEVAK